MLPDRLDQALRDRDAAALDADEDEAVDEEMRAAMEAASRAVRGFTL